jgi:nucleotide-binding universal stress UspA family protein
MQVLLYWDARDRATVEVTVALLGGLFEFSLDVLDATVGRSRPELRNVGKERVRWLPASGALEVDVPRACAGRAYDLVITPPGERPGLLRLLLGARIGTLVHAAPATIWVARRAKPVIRHMVVGVAGGPQTQHDIRLVALLAKAFGARVTLVHVLSQVPLLYTRRAERDHLVADERLARVEPGVAQLRSAGELLATDGIVTDLVVREGLVQDELLAVCAGGAGRMAADLLVVGAHLRSTAIGMDYYEDIAEQVALAAPVATLVVHAAADWSRWTAVYMGQHGNQGT